MPLVPAKCTVCGAVLTIDSSKEAAVCRSCGNAFVVENAINNYNTYNNIVNNITADTVVVQGESEKEQLHRNAETFRKLGKYEKAILYYNDMVKKFSDDWRGWWGLIMCETEDLTILSKAKEERTAYLFGVVQKLTPVERMEDLLIRYKGYLQIAAEFAAEDDMGKANELLSSGSIDTDPVVISFNSQLDNLERNLQLNIKDQETVITEKEKVCREANNKIERYNKMMQRSQTLFYTGVASLIIGLLILFVWAPANLKSHLDSGGNPMSFSFLLILLITWGLITVLLLPSGKKKTLEDIEHEKKVLSANRELLIEAQSKANQWRQNFDEKKMAVEQEKQLYIEKKAVEFAERTMLCNEYIGLGKQRIAAYHFAVKCKQANISTENDEVVELLRSKLFTN